MIQKYKRHFFVSLLGGLAGIGVLAVIQEVAGVETAAYVLLVIVIIGGFILLLSIARWLTDWFIKM